MICTVIEAWKGGSYRQPSQGLLSSQLLSIPAAGTYGTRTHENVITHGRQGSLFYGVHTVTMAKRTPHDSTLSFKDLYYLSTCI